ncbi:MAG: NAD(+)/NADH kinase [Planctomycetota bacterium]
MNTRSVATEHGEPIADQCNKRVERVAIVASPDKPAAAGTLERMQRWLQGRAKIVFAEATYNSSRALPLHPDLLFVLGGDGTLIAAVDSLGEQQLPIVGVNLGKLGYLADFTIEELEREGDFLFSGELPITRRIMMGVTLEHIDSSFYRMTAINDCVILAGPPFQMIEVTVTVDGDEVAQVRGDGLIVATPSGSTAHNLAAGGPILEPTGEAFILTPICPQALTYRPLVMDARRRIVIRVLQSNEGTTVATDGRVMRPFQPSDRIVITRFDADFLLVRNPRHSEWYALRRKLRWGERPNMQ